MKTLLSFSIVLLALTQTAQAKRFTTPLAISGTQYLFRGAQPNGNVDQLKAMGIEDVVIIKNEVKNEVTKEIAELQAAGYSDASIFHIPLKWKEIDTKETCEQTIEALQILVAAETAGRAAYLHCTAGEDRTGMVAGLASMLISGASAEEVFGAEMCARNYSNGNPGKPYLVTSAIEEGLTPLFWALASQIESGRINTEKLNPKICAKLRIDMSKQTRCP